MLLEHIAVASTQSLVKLSSHAISSPTKILCYCSFLFIALSSSYAADFKCGPFCSTRRGPTPTCKTVCASGSCKPFQGNINGRLLMLDISGEVYPRDGDSEYVTPAGCCAACKKTDGCNAWVVCNNPSGCGSGCGAYTKLHPDRTDVANRIGTFHSCTSTDGWPYQMCSLKRVPPNKPPPVFAGGSKQGWVSGTVATQPAKGCPADVTPATCAMCKKTKSFSGCIACARQRVQVGPKPGCGACSSLSTPQMRAACIKLFVRYGEDSPWLGCPFTRSSKGAIDIKALEACYGKLFAGCRTSKQPAICSACLSTAGGLSNCNKCANLPDPTARPLCSSCLTTDKPATCNNCLSLLVASLTAYGKCFHCMATTRDPEAKSLCYSCYNTNDATTCLNCVQGAGSFSTVPWYSRKGCYWYMSGQIKVGSPQYAAGIGCLKAAKNGVEAEGCTKCAFMVSEGQVAGCVAALKKQKSSRGRLYTSSCFSFDKGKNDKCLACVDKAGSNAAADKCVSDILFG